MVFYLFKGMFKEYDDQVTHDCKSISYISNGWQYFLTHHSNIKNHLLQL